MRPNWILERYFDLKLRKRIKQIEALLANYFGSPIKLERSFRNSSKDNIYNILSSNKVIAIARVRNEYRLSVLAGSSEKYNKMLVDQQQRFQREWDKCQIAHPYALAPEPLFKTDGIVVLRYVEGEKALDVIKKDITRIDRILTTILDALNGFYQLNIFHGDLSLSNCIITQEAKCVFFDLEDEMPELGSPEMKKACEYLRLIDSSLKFLPKKYRNIDFWVNIFSKYVNANAKGVDISGFKRKFKRLNMIDPNFAKMKKVFE